MVLYPDAASVRLNLGPWRRCIYLLMARDVEKTVQCLAHPLTRSLREKEARILELIERLYRQRRRARRFVAGAVLADSEVAEQVRIVTRSPWSFADESKDGTNRGARGGGCRCLNT